MITKIVHVLSSSHFVDLSTGEEERYYNNCFTRLEPGLDYVVNINDCGINVQAVLLTDNIMESIKDEL